METKKQYHSWPFLHHRISGQTTTRGDKDLHVDKRICEACKVRILGDMRRALQTNTKRNININMEEIGRAAKRTRATMNEREDKRDRAQINVEAQKKSKVKD